MSDNIQTNKQTALTPASHPSKSSTCRNNSSKHHQRSHKYSISAPHVTTTADSFSPVQFWRFKNRSIPFLGRIHWRRPNLCFVVTAQHGICYCRVSVRLSVCSQAGTVSKWLGFGVVRGQSRSLDIAPFDKVHMSSCWLSTDWLHPKLKKVRFHEIRPCQMSRSQTILSKSCCLDTNTNKQLTDCSTWITNCFFWHRYSGPCSNVVIKATLKIYLLTYLK